MIRALTYVSSEMWGKGECLDEAHGGPDVCSGKQSGFEHVGLTCETNEGEEELLGPLGECAADEGTGALQGGRRVKAVVYDVIDLYGEWNHFCHTWGLVYNEHLAFRMFSQGLVSQVELIYSVSH
jgi:hypothetical protein